MAALNIERPRLILTTHKLASRPGLFTVLVTECTRPTEPMRRDRVARLLLEKVKSSRFPFNSTAARFAVSNAINDLRLLAKNGAWSWSGRIVNQLALSQHRSSTDAFSDLSPLEVVHYLVLYLEADGAAMIKYMEILTKEREATLSTLEKRAADIIVSIIDDYLSMGLPSKVEREWQKRKERLRREGYDASTTPHKVLPHVLPLVDFGLLRAEGNMTSGYRFYLESDESIGLLLQRYADLRKLEYAIDTGLHFEAIPPLIFGNARLAKPDAETIRKEVALSYAAIRDTTTGVANLDALARLVYLRLLERGLLSVPTAVQEEIGNLHSTYPSAVRYHVDARGQPNFVVLDTAGMGL